MELEITIIKTEDANTVIEKITFNNEIDVLNIQSLNEGFNSVITELENKIFILNDYKTTSIEIQKLVEEKIANLKGDIFSCQEQINNNLKYLN